MLLHSENPERVVNLSGRETLNKLGEASTATTTDEQDQQQADNDGKKIKAKVNTVNARLMSEIQKSEEQLFAPKSEFAKKSGKVFSTFRSEKTDEERQRSIEEARNLNGVNPLVALTASAAAFAGAAGLWFVTGYLAALFATHPITTDVYALQRLFSVFRNLVMGLSSLASGFFGVVGMGLFLLGVRVAYGVSTGELDPTPIVKKNPLTGMAEKPGDQVPNVWDFMLGKKKRDGSNPFL